MIDFKNANTYPWPLLEYLKEAGSNFLPFEDYEDFRKSISNLFGVPIDDLLKDTTFRAFHFSRVLDSDKIMQNGLQPLSLDLFEELILPVVLDEFNGKEKEAILKTHNEYKRSRVLGSRKNQLCFTSDRMFSYADGGSRFWKTFGGEYSLVLINSSGIKEGVERLSKIGTPYAFEIEVCYSDTDLICRSQIINRLLDHIFHSSSAMIYQKDLSKNLLSQ